MKVKSYSYPEYKTARQWALHGYLPMQGAEGIRLWASGYYQKIYTYYSPDQVTKVTKAQLDEFFAPERERRRKKDKERREQHRNEVLEERAREAKKQHQALIKEIATPYQCKIEELHKIILEMSNQIKTSCEGNECYVIDAEMTGLDPQYDELLQLSIINDKGKIVFNSYFKPCVETWDEAQCINHISPAMVRFAPSFASKVTEINAILRRADRIIGYNTQFDVNFLKNNGIVFPENIKFIDAMKEFAIIYDDWDEYYKDYKYKKLTFAAQYYGYDWNCRAEQAHNSLADCYATLFVYNKMNNR